jgi:hypothetical protein
MAKPIAAAAPAGVRRPVKRLFRGFGVATSDFRPLPDYLIIGTHRGGTTSLHSYLQQHPCVGPPFPRLQDVKGVRFFDQNFFRGIAWYRSHFPTAAYRSYLRRLHGEPVMTGEASPYYLFHPAAAERAAEAVPQAKIIVLLRDPIERAYSHWKRERRDGAESLEAFEDAIAAEPGRLAGEVERILSDDRYYSYAHENFSYITQGLYLDSLRRWLEHYPREQVYIEVSERFLDDPQGVYDRVLRFLGLPPFALRDPKPLNVTGRGTSQELGSETRRGLRAHIAPHNRGLEKLLGIELGWAG